MGVPVRKLILLRRGNWNWAWRELAGRHGDAGWPSRGMKTDEREEQGEG